MSSPPQEGRHAPAVVIVVVILILAAVMYGNRGPEPKPSTAPASEFSAERAVRFHREVLVDAPHPVGSAAHDQVLARLVAQFHALGYDASVERTFACNASATCAPVANVLARKPGGASDDVLVLAAHYDSVAAGPGATDDGAGVATMLEVARAMRNDQLRNKLLFLITDAEETGLIGAEGFVADANASRGVTTVINVEARGTTGLSYLFETSRQNKWLLPIVARNLPEPATSSFFFSIYDLLPNDTDLTVFKRAGYTGLNFANIGHVTHYHTPLDNFAHLSPRLLQHDGDHVLAMARALGNTELRQTADDNAVWFDVLQLFLVWWPQRWCMPLALLMLALVFIAAGVRVRDGQTSARAITLGVASFFITLLAALFIGIGAAFIFAIRTQVAVFVAQPGPIIATMWLIGIGTAIITAKRLHSYAGFDGLFLGHSLCWCVISIALAMVLPGASFLAIVPAAALAISAVVSAARETDAAPLVVVCAAVTAILYFPLSLTLYEAIGLPTLPITAVVLALVATTFAPILATAGLRPALVSAILVAAIACFGMGLFLQPYTSEAPRRISIDYRDDDGVPHWEADAPLLSSELQRAAAFDRKTVYPYPWLRPRISVRRAPAPSLGLPRVEVRVLSDVRGAKRQLSVLIRSPRGAPRLAFVFFAPSFESMRINGVTPPPKSARSFNLFKPGWHRVGIRGASEARIDIVLRDATPIEVIASDGSPGLPPIGAPLAAARDRSTAVPSDDGDSTITTRKTKL